MLFSLIQGPLNTLFMTGLVLCCIWYAKFGQEKTGSTLLYVTVVLGVLIMAMNWYIAFTVIPSAVF